MKNELGTRMKQNYENRSRYFLPRRTYTILRLDGKSFHSYVKKIDVDKPFDENFINAMQNTMKYLCENIQGAKFAYAQSDEISVLLTDFDNERTNAWVDGNVQKMASVSASMCSTKFNQEIRRNKEIDPDALPFFDSRVFVIPDRVEVMNYFIWRQKDAIRNSISSLAQSLYSHKQLHMKSQDEMLEMIRDMGLDWHKLTYGERYGFMCLAQFSWHVRDASVFNLSEARNIIKSIVPRQKFY